MYGPEGCTDQDCPQRKAGFHQFMSDFIQAPPTPKREDKRAAAISKVGGLTTSVDWEDLGIDEDIHHTFAHADCWALALELHKMTGWELVGFGEELYEEDEDIVQRGWVHAAVRTPAGMILDISGLQDEGDAFETLPEEAEESFTVDASLFEGMNRYFPDVDASKWAKHLLSKLAA